MFTPPSTATLHTAVATTGRLAMTADLPLAAFAVPHQRRTSTCCQSGREPIAAHANDTDKCNQYQSGRVSICAAPLPRPHIDFRTNHVATIDSPHGPMSGVRTVIMPDQRGSTSSPTITFPTFDNHRPDLCPRRRFLHPSRLSRTSSQLLARRSPPSVYVFDNDLRPSTHQFQQGRK